MRGHFDLCRGRVPLNDCRGDAFVARDAGETLIVGYSTVPTDPPSLASDDAKRRHNECEQRISGHDGDCGVKSNVVLRRLLWPQETLASVAVAPQDRPHLYCSTDVVNLLDCGLVGVHRIFLRMVEHETERLFIDRAHPAGSGCNSRVRRTPPSACVRRWPGRRRPGNKLRTVAHALRQSMRMMISWPRRPPLARCSPGEAVLGQEHPAVGIGKVSLRLGIGLCSSWNLI